MSQKLFTISASVVAIAAFAVLPAVAQAQPPEYMQCVPKSGGNYEPGCRTKSAPGKGRAELEAVTPGTKFVGISGTSVIQTHTAFGEVSQNVVCRADSSKGEITGGQDANVAVTFYGCRDNGSRSDPCGNVGTETIETAAETYSELLWLPGKLTGERLARFGGPIWTFTCGTEPVTVEGSVLGRVENIRGGTKITFAVVGGLQQYRFDEEETPYHLYTEGEESREATLQTVETQTGPGVY